MGQTVINGDLRDAKKWGLYISNEIKLEAFGNYEMLSRNRIYCWIADSLESVNVLTLYELDKNDGAAAADDKGLTYLFDYVL